MSLKKQILALTASAKVQKIELDGVDDVYIREYSAGDREFIEDLISGAEQNGRIRASVFVKSLCDSKGVRIFEDDDIDAVNELPINLVSRVFDESNKLNGIANNDKEDELTKN